MRTHLSRLVEQRRNLPLLVIDSVKVLLRSDDDPSVFGDPIPGHFAAILPKGIQFTLVFQSRQADPNGAAVLPAEREVVNRAPVAHTINVAPCTIKSIFWPWADYALATNRGIRMRWLGYMCR